jgi:hypothetical protein
MKINYRSKFFPRLAIQHSQIAILYRDISQAWPRWESNLPLWNTSPMPRRNWNCARRYLVWRQPLEIGARARGREGTWIAEASARFISQYGVKPGGRRDSCRFSSSLAKWLSCVWITDSCPRRQFILALQSRKTCCAVCGSQTTDIFSQVGLQEHYRIRHRGTEFDDNSYNFFRLYTLNCWCILQWMCGLI